MKLIEFRLNFTEFVPKGPINIGSDNGLALTRRQGIIWTNGGYADAYMRHPASMR